MSTRNRELATTLKALVSDTVGIAESRTLLNDEDLLLGEERALLTERMVDRRRHEIITGRDCARRAMRSLGMAAQPVGSQGRAPVWPAGVTGSITHTDGYVAAAVARTADVRSIGIDAEPNDPLPEGVLDHIALVPEVEAFDCVRGPALPHPDRLLFCIKEATYKAWHPIAATWLGFMDAQAHVDADRASFTVEILVEGPFAEVHGRYSATHDLLVVAIET